MLRSWFTRDIDSNRHLEDLRLQDGSRVAVIGSGPAGSLFSYFFLEMAERAGFAPVIDIYEPRNFTRLGPPGCNMCGGIVSESLVQNLATEGVNLPSSVVQRSINSYVLHTDVGCVKIDTPVDEMRIAAVHRGAGPRDLTGSARKSFDNHLKSLATERGACPIDEKVEDVWRDSDGVSLKTRDGRIRTYELVVVAVGVNSNILKIIETLGIGYDRPKVTKALVREYRLGEQVISEKIGTAMHVFLLDLPRLQFAAIIPKGQYVTLCLVGEDVDDTLMDDFVSTPEVRASMPAGWRPEARSCQCKPYINVGGTFKPFADRFVFIGDCGVTRLYKDGIGAAYRCAKAAARVAVFQGVSEDAFRRHYLPTCRRISHDNLIGRVAFMFTNLIKRVKWLRRAVLRMVADEQSNSDAPPRMSGVLWDMFTGSAPYSDIFRRMMHPIFLGKLFWSLALSVLPEREANKAGLV